MKSNKKILAVVLAGGLLAGGQAHAFSFPDALRDTVSFGTLAAGVYLKGKIAEARIDGAKQQVADILRANPQCADEIKNVFAGLKEAIEAGLDPIEKLIKSVAFLNTKIVTSISANTGRSFGEKLTKIANLIDKINNLFPEIEAMAAKVEKAEAAKEAAAAPAATAAH